MPPEPHEAEGSWPTPAPRPLFKRGFSAVGHFANLEPPAAEVPSYQPLLFLAKRTQPPPAGRSGSKAFRLIRAPLLAEPDLQRLPSLAVSGRPAPPLGTTQALLRVESSTGSSWQHGASGGNASEQAAEVHLRRTFPAAFFRTGLDEDVACHDAEVAELASQRSSSMRVAQRRGRDRARRWRQAQGRAKTLQSLGVIMQQDGLDGSPRPIQSTAPTPAEHGPEQDMAEGASATDVATDSEAQGETPKKHPTLLSTSLRPKQPKAERLSKVRQLGLERRRQPIIPPTMSVARNRAASVFMPVKEGYRAEFREVFNYYDADGDRTLTSVELLHCLADSGLLGAQRNEIKQVLLSKKYANVTFEDFVRRVVPTVRAKLAELKQTELRGLFAEADENNSGMLSIRELVREMRLLGTFPSDALVLEAIVDVGPEIEQCCRSVEGLWIWDREAIDAFQFAAIVPLLQERKARQDVLRFRQISEEFGLNREQASEWRGVLIELHRDFHNLPVDGRGPHEMVKLIHAHGLAPRIPKKTKRGVAAEVLQLADLAGGDLAKAGADFGNLLKLAGRLRRIDSQRIEAILHLYDLNRSSSLSLIEVQHALTECLIVAANKQEADEIQAALSVCVEDESGELSLEDFVKFCHSLSDRLWSIRRDADRHAAARAGYDAQQVESFRAAFATLDDNSNGFLDGDEVISAVEMLRRSSSRADTELLLLEAGINPGPGMEVTFRQFLQIMKSLDERASCGRDAWLKKGSSYASQ